MSTLNEHLHIIPVKFHYDQIKKIFFTEEKKFPHRIL
jgi:hypothetical protein